MYLCSYFVMGVSGKKIRGHVPIEWCECVDS